LHSKLETLELPVYLYPVFSLILCPFSLMLCHVCWPEFVIKVVVTYDFTFLTLVSVKCCCLSINNSIYQSYNAQSSKQRKIFAFKEKDYNKRQVGTTEHSSRVSDISNPKMCINPAPGNTQSMLRRGKVVL